MVNGLMNQAINEWQMEFPTGRAWGAGGVEWNWKQGGEERGR